MTQSGNPIDHPADLRRRPIHDPVPMQVARTIMQFAMLDPGDHVLVGVSGGPDSVVLVDCLCLLAPLFDVRIAIAHLDHGLRPETAQREADLVVRLARRLGLAYRLGKLPAQQQRGSLEERLRNERYKFFERTAAKLGCTKIAVGHHADDNAEAVLMHLMRGSGLRGLAGIPPVRGNRIIRPLIAVRRGQILDYLQRRNLPHVKDPSNDDTRFVRNQIRHHLIPLLEKNYNPGIVSSLNRLAKLCREEEEWIGARMAPLADDIIQSVSPHCLSLDARKLQAQKRPAQRRLIRLALAKWQGHLRRLSAGHIEEVSILLTGNRPCRRLDLPNSVQAERIGTVLRFHRQSKNGRQAPSPPVSNYAYQIDTIDSSPVILPVPEAGCRLEFSLIAPPGPSEMLSCGQHTILLDADRLRLPLTVRGFRPGDRLHPFGMPGTQKVKKLLIDRRVPRDQRCQLPLLLCGDVIVWVVGIRRGSLAPLSSETTRVLKVRLAGTR